jgi:hypothetical protein
VFDEIDSHKSAISFLTFFKETIQAITVVDPGKASFDFPALATVTVLVLVFGRSSCGCCQAILPIVGVGHDPAFPQLPSEGVAIVAFVQT